MYGSPRKKGNTDYLRFRPYRAIVAPDLSRRRKDAIFPNAFKSCVVVIVLLGIPVLLIVPIVTFFTSEFVNIQHFAAHAGRNLLLPSMGVFVIGIFCALLSIIRR
jgi:hypothetical protein